MSFKDFMNLLKNGGTLVAFILVQTSVWFLELYKIIQKKTPPSFCCHVGIPSKFQEGSDWTIRSSIYLCRVVQEMLGVWPKVIFWWTIVAIKYAWWKLQIHSLKDYKTGSGKKPWLSHKSRDFCFSSVYPLWFNAKKATTGRIEFVVFLLFFFSL